MIGGILSLAAAALACRGAARVNVLDDVDRYPVAAGIDVTDAATRVYVVATRDGMTAIMGEKLTTPAVRWGRKERHFVSRPVAGAPGVAIGYRTTRRAARRARGRARGAARLARARAAAA